MIYDVIYSVLVFTEKLAFFHKQLSGFTVSFSPELVTELHIIFFNFEIHSV